jgi:hypothetical protein
MMCNSSEDLTTPQRTDSTTAEEQDQEKQESISARVKEAGVSFKEMVVSLGNKAKTVTEEKTQQLKDKSAQTRSPTRIFGFDELHAPEPSTITLLIDEE